MMMSQDPFDTDLTTVLKAYAAPTPDDGFSAQVLNKLESQSKLRRRLLLGAFGLGGLIFGSQLDRFGDLFERLTAQGFKLSLPDLPIDRVSSQVTSAFISDLGSVSGSAVSLVWIMSLAIAASVILWLAKDWMDSHI